MAKKFTEKEKQALNKRNIEIIELINDLEIIKQRTFKLVLHASFRDVDKAINTLLRQYANITTEQKKQGVIK